MYRYEYIVENNFVWGFQKGATYTLSLKNGWEKYISKYSILGQILGLGLKMSTQVWLMEMR